MLPAVTSDLCPTQREKSDLSIEVAFFVLVASRLASLAGLAPGAGSRVNHLAGSRSISISAINRGAASITLARINLAESLTAQKKYNEAERVLLEAYQDANEVQGVQHWRTKHTARELVKLYEAWNKPDLAAKYRAVPN